MTISGIVSDVPAKLRGECKVESTSGAQTVTDPNGQIPYSPFQQDSLRFVYNDKPDDEEEWNKWIDFEPE